MSRKPAQSGQPPRAAGINLGAPPFMQKPSIGSSIIPAEKTGVLGKMDYMRLMKMAEGMTDKQLQQEMVKPELLPQAITAAVAMGRAKTRKASALNEMAKGPKMPTVSEQVLAELSKEDSIDRGLADMAAFAQMSQNMGSPKGGIDRGMNPTMGVKEGGIIKYQNRGLVSDPYGLMGGKESMPLAFDMTSYLGGMGLNRKQEEYARQIAEMAKAQGISEDRIPYLINTALAESSLGANPAAFKVTEGDSSAGFYQAVPTTAFDPGFGAQGFQFSEAVSEALAPFRDKNLGPGALAKQLKGTKYGDSDLYTAMQRELIENIPGNINFGIGYQNALMDRYGGNAELAAIAYNQGASYADQVKSTMEKAASGQEGFSEFEGMSAGEVLKSINPDAYAEAYGAKEGQPSYMDRMLGNATTKTPKDDDPFTIADDDPRMLEAAMERSNMPPPPEAASKNVNPRQRALKNQTTLPEGGGTSSNRASLRPRGGPGPLSNIIEDTKEVFGVDDQSTLKKLEEQIETGTRTVGNAKVELTDDEIELKKEEIANLKTKIENNKTVDNAVDKLEVPPENKNQVKNDILDINKDFETNANKINVDNNPGAGENFMSNYLTSLENTLGDFKGRSPDELLNIAKQTVEKAGGGVQKLFNGLMDSFNENVDNKTKFNIMSALPFFTAAKAAIVGGQGPLEAILNAVTGGAQAAMQVRAYEDKRKDAQDKKKLLLGRLQVALEAGKQDQVVKLMTQMSANDAAIYKATTDGNIKMLELEKSASEWYGDKRSELIRDTDFVAGMDAKVNEVIAMLEKSNLDKDQLSQQLPVIRQAVKDDYLNNYIYGGKKSNSVQAILGRIQEEKPGFFQRAYSRLFN